MHPQAIPCIVHSAKHTIILITKMILYNYSGINQGLREMEVK
jgi:hypothetical protein